MFRRAQWSNETLKLVVEGIDQGYKMAEVARKYGISRISLRNHVEERTKGKRIELHTMLTPKEKQKLGDYIDDIVK